MTEPAEVKAARKAAGLTQTEAADIVFVTLRTWQRWEAGDSPVTQSAWELFKIKAKPRK